MPVWLQVYVVGALAIVVVLQVAYTVVERPAVTADREAEDEMLRLCRELAAVFREWPDAFGVLDEIVAQFRTNTGHSMRDLLDRVEKALDRLERAAEASASAAARLSTVVTLSAATGLRIEEKNAEVADDLRLSHERADAVPGGDHGAAADAAAQSPESPST